MTTSTKILKATLNIFAICILTVLTQIGGIVFLLSILTNKWTDKWTNNKYIRTTYRFGTFLLLYSLITFLIVPVIAKPLGRVPLPLTETKHLQPLNILSCILNRNYVREEVKEIAYKVAEKMNQQFPGTTCNYLEANFPFINGFPLMPHRSHDDGKKLDLAFFYRKSSTGEQCNECPSPIGYGICEEPFPNEENTARSCAQKGYWQYSLLKNTMPQYNKKNFVFDHERTKYLANLFATEKNIEKIFIEPHLKKRLNLTSSKVRFHGCKAVRHDDHLHVQIK